MTLQTKITITTQGRGVYDIQHKIDNYVQQSQLPSGICNLFCQHTSASLIICENADPSVKLDLETFLSQLVEDGDPIEYDQPLFNIIEE